MTDSTQKKMVTLKKDHNRAGATKDGEVITADHHLTDKTAPADAAPQTEIEIASARALTRDEWISGHGPEVVANQMKSWLWEAARSAESDVPYELAREIQSADETGTLDFSWLEELFWTHYTQKA